MANISVNDLLEYIRKCPESIRIMSVLKKIGDEGMAEVDSLVLEKFVPFRERVVVAVQGNR